MFQINDLVCYGAQGVCRITDIGEREIGCQKARYYVLTPVYDTRSTVYVPVDQPRLTSKMRRTLSAEEIHALVHSVPQQAPLWIENEATRRECYRQTLSGGDRSELIHMIQALYRHRQQQKLVGKKLHLADECFLKDAEKLLYDEFACVLGMERNRVLSFILEELGRTEVG